MRMFSLLGCAASALALGIAAGALSGCEQKEPVVDIETPAGNVEVDKKSDGSGVEVDVNKDDKIVDVETPIGDVEVDKKKDGGADVDVNPKE